MVFEFDYDFNNQCNRNLSEDFNIIVVSVNKGVAKPKLSKFKITRSVDLHFIIEGEDDLLYVS